MHNLDLKPIAEEVWQFHNWVEILPCTEYYRIICGNTPCTLCKERHHQHLL